MIKIGSVTFPQSVANQVAECYSTLPKPDEAIKMIDTYIYNEGDEDIKAFSIFEYDEAGAKALDEYLALRQEAFSKIQGVVYEAADWIRVADAFKMLENGSFNTGFFNTGMAL